MNFASLHKAYSLTVTGIIHVGAHVGQEDGQYTRHGVEKRMYFEPIKATFEQLKQNCPTASLYNCALGSVSGDREMYVETANQGESCSLLKPGTHLTQYPWITFDSMETVSVRRLDEFDCSGFNCLVCDCQGFELEVFKGAGQVLRQIDYIITELNREHLYEGCALVEQVQEYLGEFGFKLIQCDWCTETWGNGFFAR